MALSFTQKKVDALLTKIALSCRRTEDPYWDYFLILEKDFNNAIRYVDLNDKNDNAFSLEFARQLVCIAAEFETILKRICKLIDETKSPGEIGDYKAIILKRYPDICNVPVYIDRYKRKIYPLKEWATGPLQWWNDYQSVKHDRTKKLDKANLKNTLHALSSLLLLELYLNSIINPAHNQRKGGTLLLRAPGMLDVLYIQPEEELPDFPGTAP